MSNDHCSLFRLCVFFSISLFYCLPSLCSVYHNIRLLVHFVWMSQIKFKENRKICLQCLHSIKLLKRSCKDEPAAVTTTTVAAAATAKSTKKYGDCCKDLFENVSTPIEAKPEHKHYVNACECECNCAKSNAPVDF